MLAGLTTDSVAPRTSASGHELGAAAGALPTREARQAGGPLFGAGEGNTDPSIAPWESEIRTHEEVEDIMLRTLALEVQRDHFKTRDQLKLRT
jgi:hypothetical protein